jgi:uncharacterized protein (TIGR03643 family)
MENNQEENYCHYSGLPSPMAYMNPISETEVVEIAVAPTKVELSEADINRIIEMAWEDRTSFDVIKRQFGLREDEVKALMKKHLRFSSYVLWRKRVENCKTKHAKTRNEDINRFKSKAQRTITANKLSKRK